MTEFSTSPKFPGYKVSKSGDVIDTITGRALVPKNFRGKRSVFVFIDGKQIAFEVARMVLHAFCPLHSPPEADRSWRIEYLDNEKWNTSLDNLRWVGPKEPIPYAKNPEFFYIPEYTRYVINRDGVIINVISGRQKKITYPDNDYEYPNTSMRKDTGVDAGAMLHRLLMMTFHPIFFNGQKLTVNHIDGIKRNHILSNLEWTTYSGNSKHAYRTGLRVENIPVKLKDVLTGEVVVYYSMADCARKFSTYTEKIWRYLHEGKDQIHFGHYLIKAGADMSPWAEFTEEDCFIPKVGTPKAVMVKNVQTEEIVIVEKISLAEKMTGIKSATIGYYLKKRIPRAKNGWMFKFVHDKTPWPDNVLSEGQTYWPNGKPERKKKYRVTNMKTGEVFKVVGSFNLKKIIGVDSRTVYWHLRKSSDGLTCKDFKIEKIK